MAATRSPEDKLIKNIPPRDLRPANARLGKPRLDPRAKRNVPNGHRFWRPRLSWNGRQQMLRTNLFCILVERDPGGPPDQLSSAGVELNTHKFTRGNIFPSELFLIRIVYDLDPSFTKRSRILSNVSGSTFKFENPSRTSSLLSCPERLPFKIRAWSAFCRSSIWLHQSSNFEIVSWPN